MNAFKTLLTKQTGILFFIVLLALFLRVYKLSAIPPSLSWDEVSIGYNAYSILKTGKDEHGRFLPLDAFVAYGDYKPPLSIYLTVPFVAALGLNELAVRLPSALFGTLTVLFTYFLVKELCRLGQRTMSRRQRMSHAHCLMSPEVLPLLSALLLAVSPWHINLSRAGFEANIALCFVVLGVYLTFLSMRKPKVWFVAFIPFVLAIYTFNSSRYFVPLLGIGIFIFFWKFIKNQRKYIIPGLVIAFILLLPIVPHLVSREARLRFTEVNIFTDPSVVLTSNRRIEEAGNSWWAKIIYNRRVGYIGSYVSHFLDHFQPEYLFVKGDGNPKFSIQDVGQLYLIEAPFLVIGIYGLLRSDPRMGLFLLYWIIMAIAPAAVARETPHALRTLNSLPTWQIFIAYGIMTIVSSITYPFDFAQGKQVSSIKRMNAHCSLLTVPCLLLIVLYGFSIIYYLHNYYAHYPKEFSGEWQYGYKQALSYVHPIEGSYDAIYMTESIGRPYMYTLFYNTVDPNEFFRTKDDNFDAAGFYHVYGFGNYRFVKDMPPSCSGRCLFIAGAGSEVKEMNKLETIHLLNGNPVLDIYEN